MGNGFEPYIREMWHVERKRFLRGRLVLLVLPAALWLIGCSSVPPSALATCNSVSTAGESTTSLAMYDKYSSQFLDEATRHPTKNLGGQVVWNTRYYLESLLTAYEATGNPKYLLAFEDSGTSAMSLVQTLHVLDVADPSAPGANYTGPYIDVTGWPTYMATYGAAIAIPTAGNAVALYAQSLYPRSGATNVVITPEGDGSLQFAWTSDGTTLQSYPISTISDLNAIASQPLVYGQSIGRIKVTGLGLPAPGSYELGNPFITIWEGEQTGGILLPFARFLLIARDHPDLVDPTLVASWQSQVLQIASSYVDQFAPDGEGGYTILNPFWMPMTDAGTDAPSDYVFAEVSLRILLFELTGDSNQLSFAHGLLQHQVMDGISTNANGWLLLHEWPDVHPWSSRSQAPAGSIWDSLSFDPTTPENSSEGAAFVEMLDLAQSYKLADQLGIPGSFVSAQTQTFEQYLEIPNAIQRKLSSSIRYQYPTLNSSSGDSITPAPDLYASAGYLTPESSGSSYWIANWQWMLNVGTSAASAANAGSIGYYLRAWARSEVAFLSACPPSSR